MTKRLNTAKNIGNHTEAVRLLTELAVIMAVVLGVKKTGNINSVTSIRKSRKVGEVMMIREYIIKISDEVMEDEIADRPQELVRCKDCKHGRLYDNNRLVACELEELAQLPEEFCSNGRRREE